VKSAFQDARSRPLSLFYPSGAANYITFPHKSGAGQESVGLAPQYISRNQDSTTNWSSLHGCNPDRRALPTEQRVNVYSFIQKRTEVRGVPVLSKPKIKSNSFTWLVPQGVAGFTEYRSPSAGFSKLQMGGSIESQKQTALVQKIYLHLLSV
jgi:hypothetical protein